MTILLYKSQCLACSPFDLVQFLKSIFSVKMFVYFSPDKVYDTLRGLILFHKNIQVLIRNLFRQSLTKLNILAYLIWWELYTMSNSQIINLITQNWLIIMLNENLFFQHCCLSPSVSNLCTTRFRFWQCYRIRGHNQRVRTDLMRFLWDGFYVKHRFSVRMECLSISGIDKSTGFKNTADSLLNCTHTHTRIVYVN